MKDYKKCKEKYDEIEAIKKSVSVKINCPLVADYFIRQNEYVELETLNNIKSENLCQ